MKIKKLYKNKIVTYFLIVLVVLAALSVQRSLAFYDSFQGDLVRKNVNIARQNQATVIFDRHGKVLYEVPREKDYEYTELGNISPMLVKAVIATEDEKFYQHEGFRPLSIMRALKNNLFDDDIQGASTITQQLVKNTVLTPERTVERKIREVILAHQLEQKYSKNEILEMYLNNVAFGGTSWGIQSAAEKFFDKDAKDLNLAEASMLAGLPQAPTLYSPIYNFETAKKRQKLVLDRMVEVGFVTQKEANQAFDQELEIAPQEVTLEAPHFVFYILKQLDGQFDKDTIRTGGLMVYTTLDLELHNKVQEIVTQVVDESSELNISNGSALVLAADTNEVLAYIGSSNFYNEKFGQVDMVNSMRQSGSTVKPVTYSLAFLSKKYTPASIIEDAPVRIKDNTGYYEPQNYDERFHGNVTLRSALANSYNIPAVKLSQKLGPSNIASLGSQLGMKSWGQTQNYGVAITLGSVETTLMQLTNSFSTFASEGVYKDVVAIKKIENTNGETLYEPSQAERKVLDENVVFLITNILSSNVSRAPAFGLNSSLNIPGHEVAVKTGTTDEKRDNYTVGYTPEYVVGTWVGNNNNEPMNERLASGLSGAAPMWNRIMNLILAGVEPKSFEKPEDVIYFFDKECNRGEYFIKGSYIPSHLCDVDNDEDDGDDENNDSDEKKDKKKKKDD